MSSVLEQLVEMGFTQAKAEKAIRFSGNKGLEEAMEWIVENDSGDEEEEHNGKVRIEETVSTLLSYKYGEVAGTFADPKVQREEQEKQEELEREKQRRLQGRTIVSAKAKYEEDEMRRLVEQKKREKEEDRAYREKLKADIAREREEKRARELGLIPPPVESNNPTPVPTSVPKSNSTVCRLQIRLPSGQSIKTEFSANELLSSVRLYISQNWPDSSTSIDPESIQLITSFPRRDFTDADMSKSLSDLSLISFFFFPRLWLLV
ncbi:unnamed protein product [Heterobilharzia americana]|nr:unnamed protein product [Heterobilharzia americana]